jgi:hypothetical protein
MWEGVSDQILGVVFDDQSRHLDTEPTCRMTVRSEDSFDFVFLVDGGNDGFGIFVNALVVAKGAGVDFVTIAPRRSSSWRRPGTASIPLLRSSWKMIAGFDG